MRDVERADFDLDGLAREATASLHASTSNLPIPMAPHSSRGWRRPTFAIATVVVVIVGLTFIVRRHESTPSINSSPSLHWLVTDLPSGWSATSADDIAPQPSVSDGASVQTKIFATDAAPVGPIISIEWAAAGKAATSLQPGSYSDETGSVDSVVNGRDLVTATTAVGGRVIYVESPDGWIRIRGRRVDDATLTAISRDVTANTAGQLTLNADVIPPGMSERPGWMLEEVDPQIEPVAYSRYLPGPDAASVQGPRPFINLEVRPAGSSVFAWLGLFAETPQPVAVAGGGGHFIAHIGGSESSTAVVAWTRGSTEFLLTGERVDRSALLAAARSVRVASAGQWQQLVDAGPNAKPARNPCSLLAVEQIATATGLSVQPGTLAQAIGETAFNMCTYAVTGPLTTIFVYLGHGQPPAGSLEATETRGEVFVTIGAQHPNAAFTPIARQLAHIAVAAATD